jgi:hypothetical protein
VFSFPVETIDTALYPTSHQNSISHAIIKAESPKKDWPQGRDATALEQVMADVSEVTLHVAS